MRPTIQRFLLPLAYFSNNLLSRAGIFLVTAAGVLWIFAIPTLLLGGHSNPYAGIVLFVILPAAFFLGLALIPLGVMLRRRALAARGALPPETLDLRKASIRRLLWFVGIATLANLAIGSQLTSSSVHYMESREFCSGACHMMQPQAAAFARSAHRQVECVRCHAGPGAAGFAQSKLAGVRQLLHTIAQRYETPIQPRTPPLPSHETCELCHSRALDYGDRLRVKTSFLSDEANSRRETVLMLPVGGIGNPSSIHGAHLRADAPISIAEDPKDRESIPAVRLAPRGRAAVTYYSSKINKTKTLFGPFRALECVDCHNRVAHESVSAATVVDRALAQGELSSKIPYLRRAAIAALETAGEEQQVASEFEERTASAAIVGSTEWKAAAAQLRRLWRGHVFPSLKARWANQPDHLGHTTSPGCFRCHDGEHKADSGAVIGQDCESCHRIAALEEAKPAVLDQLGMH